jgi:putative nucleotidyltransferase with HDIG domain
MESRNAFFNMLKDVSGAYRELDEVHNGLILVLANAIDAKSPWTQGHSERVSRYALRLADSLGLSQREQAKLRTAALLHDVGKIGMLDSLLNKPSGLTNDEYEVMKLHPNKSADILIPIPRLGEIIDIVRYHHEHYDGTGYPRGLKAADIPLMSRVLCIADSFDSMTADRPYRSSLGREYAIKELRACAGTHFDPALTEVFIKLIEEERI